MVMRDKTCGESVNNRRHKNDDLKLIILFTFICKTCNSNCFLWLIDCPLFKFKTPTCCVCSLLQFLCAGFFLHFFLQGTGYEQFCAFLCIFFAVFFYASVTFLFGNDGEFFKSTADRILFRVFVVLCCTLYSCFFCIVFPVLFFYIFFFTVQSPACVFVVSPAPAWPGGTVSRRPGWTQDPGYPHLESWSTIQNLQVLWHPHVFHIGRHSSGRHTGIPVLGNMMGRGEYLWFCVKPWLR